ncbi:HlyD family efflux transporter periplasmic adaptor subunit [Psychroflexus sp. CAK57W]|uniref:HlyD family secretion protein n=1 Tax=Psychroflexus curvus TaxID=2873595 RepID=UPI001CCB4C45|nr:HlyD family efflux transporter periplasmic adaptor subunit [Psychroflexus curvus]MBZ9627870.1 HlyD family efflux transporter periplasmic adaptor subunit [Psychroflexus curvus]MBZ9787547.1 HlyD family efflux transporter periplasmic adaptor subunit [Psychroflexus curvus]
MKTISKLLFLPLLFIFTSCSTDEKADAYGNFETTSVLVSAENTAKIMALNVDEGTQLNKNQMVGYQDTITLHLKKQNLKAKKEVIQANSASVLAEIDVLSARVKTAKINRNRIEQMLSDNAATQQQLDNIQGEINALLQQINSVKSKNVSVLTELQLIEIQLKELEDLIEKSMIKSPMNGRVLNTYAEASEVAQYGKPLFEIADLSKLEIRAYISEPQLTEFVLGDQVQVKVDSQDGMLSYEGHITWIADEAEFTPKIIQTKEERVALVYAIKVEVENDGKLKIGMPAEVWLE